MQGHHSERQREEHPEPIHSGSRRVHTQITRTVGAQFLGREVGMVERVGPGMGWWNYGVNR